MTFDVSNYSYDYHLKYINIALEMAKSSLGDMPIASLIVKNDSILAASTNKKEIQNDPTAHAEMLVIKEACQKLNHWRLEDTIIYSTLEPCPMCACAILFSRIPIVVFSAYDELYGAMGSRLDLTKLYTFYNPHIIGGIAEEQSKILLKSYFKEIRNG